MFKNVANQSVKAQLNSSAGAAVTSGTTNVFVTGNNGAQSAGGGTVTHRGNGCWDYQPTQAETNFDNVGFTFVNASAVTVTEDLYPVDTATNTIASAGISTVAESWTELNGANVSGDYTDTTQLNLTYHIIEPDSGGIEFYYQFDIGVEGVPISVDWDGYAQQNNDNFLVYAYNWATESWDQIGTITPTNSATVQELSFPLTTSHVGIGSNDGKVRWRVESTDGVRIATDRITCSYTIVPISQGYEGGYVWVDEVNGTSNGTTPGQDGLITKRCIAYENAQAVAAALGYQKLGITNGNTITLSQAITNFIIGVPGANWTLALGGQSISNCDINDANVTGICTGTDPHFHNCIIGAATCPPAEYFHDGFGDNGGTFTFGSSGNYRFIDCYSDRPGSSAPVFDFNSVGSILAHLRRWSGGIRLNNLSAGDIVSIDCISGGTITIDGTGGSVNVRGIVEDVVDLSGGLVTIVKKAALISVGEGIILGTAQTGTLSTTQASTDLTGYDTNQLASAVIVWLTGPCEGERSRISANSSGGLLTFTQLTTAPQNGNRFKIV